MPHINLSQELFQQIEEVLPTSASVDGFVREAVREKIAWKERRDEFFRISDKTRKALEERGLSEQDLLDDFEAERSKHRGKA